METYRRNTEHGPENRKLVSIMIADSGSAERAYNSLLQSGYTREEIDIILPYKYYKAGKSAKSKK